ncbi:LCP family protein [Saccharomonospora sp. NPDC006951]
MTGWPNGPVERPSSRRGHRVGVFAMVSGKVILSLISVTILALTWYGWQFVRGVNSGVTTTDVFDGAPAAVPLDGAIDILLVGQDSRTDAKGNPLPQEVLDHLHAGEATGERQTDTMILVHIPQDGTRAVAISFPRDSWVEIAGGYGNHKLNSAFVYAYNDTFSTLRNEGETDLEAVDEKAKVAGRKNLIATIEQFIGKPGMIDRYAEVNLASFYEVTKALGGVEVCLNSAVKEPKSGVNLPEGRQTLEGVQALAFVRQRYGLENGDLDRIARQQAFLSGLVRKMLSPDILLSPSKINDVIEAVQKSVVLSQDWDLLEFAAQMRGLSGGQVEFHTIPTLGLGQVGAASVVEVDVPSVRAFVDDLTSDGSLDNEEQDSSGTPGEPPVIENAGQYTVDIYDGTGANLGPSVRQHLGNIGFLGDSSATVDGQSDTVVHYAPGDEDGVEALRQALGADLQAVPDNTVTPGSLTVTLGSGFELPEGGPPPSSFAAEAPPRQPPATGTEPDTPADQPITAGGVPCVN